MQRFSLRTALLGFLALSLISASAVSWRRAQNVLDMSHGQAGECPVHHRAMSKELVGLTYGMRLDEPIDYARRLQFPHANEPYDTGACLGSRQQWARVWVCPDCTAERELWIDQQHVIDVTANAPNVCPLHGEPMQKQLVELMAGLIPPGPIDAARPTEFPHADEPYHARRCDPPPQEHARVYVCRQCTAAYQAWWAKAEAEQAGASQPTLD
ncbi:hypothetical protein Pla123a_41950 [Posidoniimonas polymericola]|uniref:Uncharacterized protein n=1 Tax=Posidoniimonas polymericola TaxID=2528002 RepID=A0A5C5XYN2_9BACT|nr:hypothetical protein [Posidoniimonas polymericola]TWT67639.1 hypothetical protein Pla123a_41950 [Posidoniimonas polymericola]